MAKREEQPNRWVLRAMMALSVLMALSGQGMARRVRAVTPYLLGPLADMGMYVTTAFRGSFRGDDERRLTLSKADQQLLAALARGDLAGVDDVQLARLQEIMDTQMVRLARHWRAQAESDRARNAQLSNFRDLFSPNQDLSCELIPAHVFAADSQAYGRTRLVNAGRRHGAMDGDQVTTRLLLTNRAKALEPHDKLAVVTGTVLVGRLGETGAYTARLILVTDRAFRMAAQIDRKINYDNPRQIQVEELGEVSEKDLADENNAYVSCLATGNGSDAVIVGGVSRDDNIKPGDELVARVLGTYESTPILIGKVVEVIDDPKLGAGFDQLRIEPAVDLAALREVLIVVPTLGILEDDR